MARLDHVRVLEVHAAAVQAGLAHSRDALLGGLSPAIAGELPAFSVPNAQLLSDLNQLNERQAEDGAPLLSVWLTNAEAIAGGRSEAEIFARARAEVERAPESRPASRPAGSSAGLLWVHVSDIHFGHGSAAHRADQRMITRELLADARRMREQLGSPDFIFVTGDVAFSAEAEQYLRADAWLADLLAAVGLEGLRERVFIVAGNHDVDRAKTRHPIARDIHRVLRDKPDQLDDYLEHPGSLTALWPKMEAFAAFAKRYGAPQLSAEAPFWTVAQKTALGPVVIAGLSSALLSFDNGDSSQNLALGKVQIERALHACDDSALLFVLQHHPAKWLSDGGFERRVLGKRAHVWLSGHEHAADNVVERGAGGQAWLSLFAGATHPEAREGDRAAYGWGRLSRAGLEYFPRAHQPKRLVFVADDGFEVDARGACVMSGEQLPPALRAWLAGSPQPPVVPVVPKIDRTFRTARDAYGLALGLDRTKQWEELRKGCLDGEDRVFVLHGEHRQNIGFFVDRVRFYLGRSDDHDLERKVPPHHVVEVLPESHGEGPPATATDWFPRIAEALGGAGTLGEMLASRTAREAVLLAFGPFRFDRLSDEAWDALRKLITMELPQLAAGLSRTRRPIRVLVTGDYPPDDAPRRNAVAVAKARIGDLHRWRGLAALHADQRDRSAPDIEILDSLELPTWKEIEDALRPRLSNDPEAGEILARFKTQYMDIGRTHWTFEQLSRLLDCEL